MKRHTHRRSLTTHCATCRGFALPTLMVMLGLASIASLLALRNLWVNDQWLNAHADQLRTEHKAEAVLPVALADILGAATNADGSSNLRHVAGSTTQSHPFFPTSLTDYDLLRQRLSTLTNPCSAGICTPNALDTKATKSSFWKTQLATAMPVSANDTPYGDNTAWYWVEVFVQNDTSTANASPNAPFIYRITTLANGVMPSSTTVLQAVWVRNTGTASTGQWRSWHVLHD